MVGSRGAGNLGFTGFSRTSASLLNVCLLLTPLVGLALGASAVAGDRERGTLQGLFAQPLARWEYLIGVYIGLLTALALATGLGFGVAGIVIALLSPVIDPGGYALLLMFVLALAAVMLSLGILLSVVAGTRTRALSGAIGLWFVLVLFFNLGLIGVTLGGALGSRGLIGAPLLNPVDIARVPAVLQLEPRLDVLGPAGSYFADRFGAGGATALLTLALAAWLAVPLSGALWALRRHDV